MRTVISGIVHTPFGPARLTVCDDLPRDTLAPMWLETAEQLGAKPPAPPLSGPLFHAEHDDLAPRPPEARSTPSTPLCPACGLSLASHTLAAPPCAGRLSPTITP
jgi:hypothetical protein